MTFVGGADLRGGPPAFSMSDATALVVILHLLHLTRMTPLESVPTLMKPPRTHTPWLDISACRGMPCIGRRWLRSSPSFLRLVSSGRTSPEMRTPPCIRPRHRSTLTAWVCYGRFRGHSAWRSSLGWEL
ncbi:MAG: hypothetical protein AAGJ35_09150 [Myxococcota bacterium]